jgi:hypothetical protein
MTYLKIIILLVCLPLYAEAQCNIKWSIQQKVAQKSSLQKNEHYIPVHISFHQNSLSCADYIIVKVTRPFDFSHINYRASDSLFNNSLNPLKKLQSQQYLLPISTKNTTQLMVKVPSQLLLSPKAYRQDLEILVMKSNKERPVKQKKLNLLYVVEPIATLNIHSGISGNILSKHSLDFGEIKEGKSREVQLIAQSNTKTNLLITSQNAGLTHTRYNSSKIEYQIKIKDNKFIPTQHEKSKKLYRFTQFGKITIPIEILITDKAKIHRAGNYTDQLTIKLEVKL